MARHHAFWVILAGAVATAFRSPRREDLLPTLHQLQRTQPDVTLQWFDRGKLWESPEAARVALVAKRPQFADRKADWRPGGAHRDPRARYQLSRDEKRARFKKRLGRPPLEARPEKPFDSRPDRSNEQRPPRDRWQKPGWKKPDASQRPEDRWRKPKPFGKRPFRPHGVRTDRPPGAFDKPSGRPPGRPTGRPPGKFSTGRPPGKFSSKFRPPRPRGRKPPR